MGDSPSSDNGNDTVEVSRDDRMSPGRATAQFGSEIGSLAGGYSESQVQNEIDQNEISASEGFSYSPQEIARSSPMSVRPGAAPSFTQQSQNYVDDFSGATDDRTITPRSNLSNAAIGSLPISQTNMMRGKDNTDFNFANSNAAKQLRDNTNLTGGTIPLLDALYGLPSQMKLNALYRGESPVYGPTVNGRMTGDFITDTRAIAPQTEGTIGGLPNNQLGIIGGLNTNPRVDYGLDETTDDGGNDNNEIIRRRMAGEVIPEEELDPALSDDLAINYLQDPYYLYSGQGNLYQPYGYAQGTLVDLLRTRNLTQPQQAASNLGLFGNPGDFS